MSDPKKTSGPAPPFSVDDSEWEFALADWDARLPISTDGAKPDGENPVIEASIAAQASAAQLVSGGFDSTVASLAASADIGDGPFGGEPPPEGPVSLLVEPLPEMGDSPWRGDLRQLVDVPDLLETPAGLASAYWKTLASQLVDQRSAADTAAQQANLGIAAARAAERAGEPGHALDLYDDALVLQPNNAAARRGRFRLLEARGDRDGAFAALGRLVDAVSDDEWAFYRVLHAEWALARGEKASAALPAGLARWLAEAELAIRRGDPAAAAATLDHAAHTVGGRLGAALLMTAARFNAVSGDVASAAEQRLVAARLGGVTVAGLVGRLPDIARMSRDDPAGAAAALDEMLPALPASALATAVARWAAWLARRRGDQQHAVDILTHAASMGDSPALRADRLDLATSGGVFDRAVVDALFAAVAAESDPPARCVLAWRQARALARSGATADALAISEAALAESPQAIPLALLAETLAATTVERDQRARALRLWATHDPARTVTAGWASAQITGVASEGAAAPAAAWRELARGSSLPLAFWKWSAAAWSAGDSAGAVEALTAAVDRWPAVAAAAAWRERIAELRAAESPSGPAALRPDEIVADGPARASGLLERALAIPATDYNARCDALEQVLAAAPEHPIALGLLMLQGAHRPDAVATALWAMGTAAAGAEGLSRVSAPALDLARHAQLQAIEWLIQGGNRVRALDLGRALLAGQPDWPPAHDVLQQLAATAPGATERARATLALAEPAAGEDAALALAEAHEQVGERQQAAALFARLAGGAFAADAQRGLARLDNPSGDTPINPRLDGWLQAARGGRWGELVDRLETEPPHEQAASAATLYLAALLDEGRRDGKRSARLIREALAPASTRRGEAPLGLLPALRALDAALAGGAAAADIAAAAQAVASRMLRGEGPRAARSAAAMLVGVALSLQRQGNHPEAETLLRGALAHDPHSLPALAGLRALLAGGPGWREVVDLCEREAALLRVPAHRAETLLFAARIVLARGADDPSRAVSLLRQVLTICPDNQDAFERLREVLEHAGDFARLADLLSARIAVADKPSEITALRLARADLLCGKLGDRPAARAELGAILHKEPQHDGALSRLADLEYEESAFAEAAELYISCTRSERSPERLREIFLRLGRIYLHKVPDAKRAAGAYGRLLQLDPGNREALEGLSDLYTAAGEHKNALVLTERLVDLERDGSRRAVYLVRLGQLWERAGDPRQAATHFRRAVDAAPRDLLAIGELARYLERTQDFTGRRVLLDHALSALRFEIQEGRLSLETLRATIPILEWRGKTPAAAAAVQLIAAVSDDPDARQALAGWAAPPPRGRSLQALANPDVDDQLFPPGLLPGVRNIFRLLGPALVKGPPELKAYNLGRGEHVPRGHAPRDVIDPIAAQLGVVDFEVHVQRPQSPTAAAPLMAEPGTPPALVLGAEIVALGPAAVRFAAGRAMRLFATHLDFVLRQSVESTGALVAGVVRQFVPDFQHPEVPEAAVVSSEARVARLLSRKLRQEVMHFALESARGFDLPALVLAVRDGANSVGFLAAGDLPASLAAILATRGGGRRPLTLGAIAADEQALGLLNFALSDLYADLCRAMEQPADAW